MGGGGGEGRGGGEGGYYKHETACQVSPAK